MNIGIDSDKKFFKFTNEANPDAGVQGGQRASEDPLALQRSLLVYSGHKSPFQSSNSDWTRTQRRLYHRVLSGLEMAKRSNDYPRVMVLTSSSDSGDIHRSFDVLKKRIRRKYGRFEYLSVKELTKEGFKHLHIIYRGRFISQKWLSEAWEEIHKAKIVWISRLSSWKYARHLARYYIKEAIGRFWSSWNWVYRGFTKDWKRLVHEKGFLALNYWHRWLRNWTPETKMDQPQLFDIMDSG